MPRRSLTILVAAKGIPICPIPCGPGFIPIMIVLAPMSPEISMYLL